MSAGDPEFPDQSDGPRFLSSCEKAPPEHRRSIAGSGSGTGRGPAPPKADGKLLPATPAGA